MSEGMLILVSAAFAFYLGFVVGHWYLLRSVRIYLDAAVGRPAEEVLSCVLRILKGGKR